MKYTKDTWSKGKLEMVEQEMPGARDVSARASRVLLGWIANPRVVLLEDNTKVLGEEYWDQWDKHEYIVTMDWQEILGEKLLG